MALVCAKYRKIIFCTLLDIRENVEWPRFLAHFGITAKSFYKHERIC